MKTLATFRPASPKAKFIPVPLIEWRSPEGTVFNFNRRQRKLYAAANAILAKAGLFEPKSEIEEIPVDPMMLGRSGLRPMWHGRA